MSPEELDKLMEYLSHETGVDKSRFRRNSSTASLYEEALRYENGTIITSTGALSCISGHKTGRSPKDKRVVKNPESSKDIWWGPVNIPMEQHIFDVNRERAVDFLRICKRVYVFDGYAGWDRKHRKKIRVISARAYHCLFMQNMLIRPTEEELGDFGEVDFTILNAGEFPANRFTSGMTSATSVCLDFEQKEMVILGTLYAGEMKKGIFSVMNYLMPKEGCLSLHSSCNVKKDDPSNVTLFFGLSGTGKTTLSTDEDRLLIGDDEHCWSEEGVFNIEGGCYAKCINLSYEKEPEIFEAIKFGSVLENVVMDPLTRVVDYSSSAITENTRCAYPIEHIRMAQIPCIANHPRNIILLTCDAFGVLPPVARLTKSQTMYHFISGYTSKVAGTEDGIKEAQATFSSCYGEPFLVWHPLKYAEMLAERLEKHSAAAWLINTGWIGGGSATTGASRCPLKYTRAILDIIHSGQIDNENIVWEQTPIFSLSIPSSLPGIPEHVLNPMKGWANQEEYLREAGRVASLFLENMQKYSSSVTEEILSAGPKL